MMHIVKRFFIGCSYVFMSHATLMAQEAPKILPAFKFQALHTNSAFTNLQIKPAKYIILNFYDPGCGHCQKLAVGMAANMQKFKQAQILFIAMNDAVYIDGFINMHIPSLKSASNITFLRDPEVTFIPLFNPSQYPSMYIYDGTTKKLIKHLDGIDTVDSVLEYIVQ